MLSLGSAVDALFITNDLFGKRSKTEIIKVDNLN